MPWTIPQAVALLVERRSLPSRAAQFELPHSNTDATLRQAMPPSRAIASASLSDSEYDALELYLQICSPFDLDGLLGMLHAVGSAPGLVPPSAWLPVLLPKGIELTEGEGKLFIDLIMRLYNYVLGELSSGAVIVPEEDDLAGWESFAAGYLAGAMEDPVWVNNDDHWTFAAWAAYLDNQPDLVEPELRSKLDAEPDTRASLCRQGAAIVSATYDSFLKDRSPTSASAPGPARVGRNDPCPCGSGKKFKRCCIDQPTH